LHLNLVLDTGLSDHAVEDPLCFLIVHLPSMTVGSAPPVAGRASTRTQVLVCVGPTARSFPNSPSDERRFHHDSKATRSSQSITT
jgi:hypothetical protein